VFLRDLHVENVRAIRTASVRFDASTTLVGENDSGKGSLLRALELVLGSSLTAPLDRTDFHQRGGAASGDGVLRIALTFEERAPGDWDDASHAILRHAVPVSGSSPRQLRLHATGMPASGRNAPALRFELPGVADAAVCQHVVDHVRATTPLIRLVGGTLTGHLGDETRQAFARQRPADTDRPGAGLMHQILQAADEILSGTALDPESCIASGAAAARELLAQIPRHVDPAAGGLASSIREILGQTGTPSPREAARGLQPTFADRLGTLLLLAAILRHIPKGVAAGVEPLWVIEDPEAHLHPMTLAATERLLTRIRWQKIVTTQSGDLLSATPLADIRRLVRHEGSVRAAGLRPRALAREHLRRIGYHLRMHRGVAMFARVWLLVEGESEFWIVPQVAQVMGYDLPLEGICPVGFAQCGIDPLVRTAREFGIEWHLLADGDEAGRRYVDSARAYIRRGEEDERITFLPERDIEHCFWENGHAETIAEVAGLSPAMADRVTPTQAIARAVQRKSKPFLALRLVESAAAHGPEGVPPPLARLIETCVRLARLAPERAIASQNRGS
jgi:putative ATP-dependent endonuclease of OLD family